MAHPQHAIPIVLMDGEVRPVARAPLVERMSWALYDFSNTIFSMNVATLYFTVWLVSDLGVSNTLDAVASAVSSALVFISIPFLGALSDGRRRRKNHPEDKCEHTRFRCHVFPSVPDRCAP